MDDKQPQVIRLNGKIYRGICPTNGCQVFVTQKFASRYSALKLRQTYVALLQTLANLGERGIPEIQTAWAVCDPNCSIPGHDAVVIEFFSREEDAEECAAKSPGCWIEELPLGVVARHEVTGEWRKN